MTSLIEKAAERLEQLRRAGLQTSQEEGPEQKVVPPYAQANSEVAAASAVSSHSLDSEIASSRSVKLDLSALASQGYVTPNEPRSPIADQFRVIKRPLLVNASGRGASIVQSGNLIMVTSAMAGEGKSFNAVNLAMSIAMEQDHRVLLVDADVARPSLTKTLGLPPGPGLLDLLVGKGIQVSDALLRTNVEKLSVLPSGTPHPRATELLASDAMTSLVEEMGRRYPDRIIIFDSPPLLLTTEARVLATHMGQIVMVVQAEKTLQSEVAHALTTIEACPVRLMLLNQARGGDQAAYGYGYGYGSGSAQFVAAGLPVAAPQ